MKLNPIMNQNTSFLSNRSLIVLSAFERLVVCNEPIKFAYQLGANISYVDWHFSNCFLLSFFVQAVNEVEALHGQVMNHASSQLDGPVDVMKTGDLKCIHRTTPRISLTCRLVPKVHKNVFRF